MQYFSFSPKDLQLTALKGIINIKKVLPIDGQPRLVFIKMTDLLAVGRSFLFMYVFSELVAKTYTSNYQSEKPDKQSCNFNRHTYMPSYTYSGKPVSI